MLAISLQFPAKKFHATPWGRQVNEGAVEWPPSPWRLLRALVATWHHKFPDVPEENVRELVEKLAPPPCFSLPPASQGHTRHYMPQVNDDRTKVFDTFVLLAPDEDIVAVWRDVDLSDAQRDLLDRLLGAMTYFGRAESWVCGTVLDTPPAQLEVEPIELGQPAGEGRELVRTLVPILAEDHVNWFTLTREQFREQKLAEQRLAAAKKGKSTDKVKLTSKDELAIANAIPATLFDALHADTSELRRGGWNQPPGTRWINYARPTDAFMTQSPSRQRKNRRGFQRPAVARFALCGRVRPLFTDQLWFADEIRRRLMGCSRAVDRQVRRRTGLNPEDATAATVFSGKFPDGQPLRDPELNHCHCHILCEATQDLRITHVTLFAPMGFDSDDERAIERLVDPRAVRNHPLEWNGYEVQLVLLGMGQPSDFGGINEHAGQSRLLATSRVWESRTPFILTRHLTRKGMPSAETIARDPKLKQLLIDEVRRELSNRPQFQSVAADVTIEPVLEMQRMGTHLNGPLTKWIEFRRERKKGGGAKVGSTGFGFLLTFPHRVSGPIALGYGSHFGMGTFRCVTGPENDES
ncbi:type I-U CRISPR-associated protein Csb2 [Schlesneria sp. DSM 10557]|uniref:type I-G CRISPR-associated protein Csb2 n=1 Tax=Schlesneria sp. DSM 10557 TaxID=3044399 RepID=UPI0035A04F85